jgi:hypothetical protein
MLLQKQELGFGNEGLRLGDDLGTGHGRDLGAQKIGKRESQSAGKLREVDALRAAAERVQRRVTSWQKRAELLDPVGRAENGPDLVELDIDAPADVVPVPSGVAELYRFGGLVRMGAGDTEGANASVGEREDEVARGHLTHEFIERIAAAVRLALGRPEIPAFLLLAIGLVLVHPPEAHRCTPRS